MAECGATPLRPADPAGRIMVVSLPFRRFVQQLSRIVNTRPRSRRLRQRGWEWQIAAAEVQILEVRQLLSSIVVNSTSGGQNYASTVTALQLDPTHTAVTLRDAVNAANNTKGADSISFDASVFPPNAANPTTITLSGGTPLELSDTSGATTISGPGAAGVAVSGANASTVLVVDNNVTATISGLTITGGKGTINFGGGQTGAGGIDNNGKLSLQDVTFSGNAGGSFGGGLYNNNVVTITSCSFTGNSAQFGGGMFSGGTATVTSSTFNGNSAGTNGGGFYNLATITLESSTLSNNSASGSGGGFFSNNRATVVQSTIAGNSAGSSGGGFINSNIATVIDSTIAGNFSTLGGGIYNPFSTLSLTGTIVAQNSVSPTNSASRDWGGSAASATSSYNLIGDGTNSGLVNGTNHNLVGSSSSLLNPLLAPLGNYGGPTQTIALLPGSLAIDAGGTALPVDPTTGLPLSNDQRGAGFSRLVGSAIDIGAVEQPFTQVATGMTAPSVTFGQHGFVVVTVAPQSATGTLALFVDSSSTAIGTHTLTAADNGSFTFDVGILNAGAHSLHAVYTATGNFLSSAADGSLVVNKASALLNIIGYNVTYDGSSHTAIGTATGVGGVDLSADLNLTGTIHTNAGTYADSWTFHDASGNYADASGTVGDSIARANAAINVVGFSGTYDGSSHAATGTAMGVGSIDLSAGLSLSGTAHTNAGNYTSDGWTFTDGSGNYNNASGTVIDSIARANAAINVTGYSVTYDGNSHAAIGSAAGVGGVDLSTGLDLSGTLHVHAGGYAADVWTFTDTTGNYNDASGTVDDSIARANATISVASYSVTFDGNSHTATGTATGVSGVDLSAGLDLSGTTHANAGLYADSWTFHDASGNYNDASATANDSIARATATISVTGYSVTFDGISHTATGTAIGVGGVDLSSGLILSGTTHASAGNYSGDGWTFHDASGNYVDASGTVVDSIAKANAAISVTGYCVTFDGNSHTATGTTAGVGGVDLSSGLDLSGTAHANAGTYSGDGWTFHDATGNYNDASGTVVDTIIRANAVISVTGYSVTFDGNSHTVTGAAAGVGGVDLSSGLVLSGTTHINAGTYSGDAWTFHDATGNYNDASGTVVDTITRANAVISVAGYSVTFDGNSHTATGTAAGIGGVDLSSGLVLSGTTHINAGNYSGDGWTFHDATGNYNDASGTVVDSIAKANAVINVVGFSGTYDGMLHGASGTASGVGGVDLSAQLNLGASFKDVPGGTAHWTFSGGTNYNDAAGDVSIVITSPTATADLRVTRGETVQIAATNASAGYNFDVRFGSGGVTLVGTQGTTFNGAQTLFIAGARSISGQLGNGNDQVRITGTGKNVSLSLGAGQNSVALTNFSGEKFVLSSVGALTLHAERSTLDVLHVTGGSAADRFETLGLRVFVETQLDLGSGANTVQIDDSRFRNFELRSSGNGTIVSIEAGKPDGIGTQFGGLTVFQLGHGAQVTISPDAKSDPTYFHHLTIDASSADGAYRSKNVEVRDRPTFHNVDTRSFTFRFAEHHDHHDSHR